MDNRYKCSACGVMWKLVFDIFGIRIFLLTFVLVTFLLGDPVELLPLPFESNLCLKAHMNNKRTLLFWSNTLLCVPSPDSSIDLLPAVLKLRVTATWNVTGISTSAKLGMWEYRFLYIEGWLWVQECRRVFGAPSLNAGLSISRLVVLWVGAC